MHTHLNCLIVQLRRWMSFSDSHVFNIHCDSQKTSALNLANNPNECGYA